MLENIAHRFKVAFKARDVYIAAHNLKKRQEALSHYMVHEDPEIADTTQTYLANWDADVLHFFGQYEDTLDLMAVWPDLDEANWLLAQIQRLHIEGDILWGLLSE